MRTPSLSLASAPLAPVLFALFVAGSSALLPHKVLAQGPVTAVTGRVSAMNGRPLSDVHIEVTDVESGQTSTTLTDGTGRYAVTGLPVSHHYRVLIRRIGFAPFARQVQADERDPADPVVDARLLPVDVAVD